MASDWYSPVNWYITIYSLVSIFLSVSIRNIFCAFWSDVFTAIVAEMYFIIIAWNVTSTSFYYLAMLRLTNIV
jgi:hypothetical protein